MKNILTIILCLAFTIGFAQDKGINLVNNKSSDTTFLKENRRIKVKTTDGKSIAGKFTIINDSEINIKGKIVEIDSIVSIRKASTFSAIARPISITFGAVFILVGVGGVVSGGYAVFLVAFILPGLPLFIVPITANKHPIKKWKYEIVSD